MFTGIIETTGEVLSFAHTAATPRLTIAAPHIAPRLRTGDSVAVNGVCLTALDIQATHFSADLAAETVARTTLSRLRPGSVVNLELPTPAGAPLGGHVVQGHVDAVGTLVALDAVTPSASTTDWVLRIRVPQPLLRYIAEKGSITIEGISLTVAAIDTDDADEIRIAILPHTYANTNLHTLAPGAVINIEVDILAKYAESRAQAPRRELTLEYLLANGY
jgi:riboflavin synthase